jgi:chromosomal replication initiation ATPase DnaA
MTIAKFRTPREQLLAQKPKLVDTSKINHDQLINAVKEVFDISNKSLIKKCRERDFVLARNMCYFILHMEYKLRASQIAPLFKRDRTTVLYGINTFVNDVEIVPYYMEKYEQVKSKIKIPKLYSDNY